MMPGPYPAYLDQITSTWTAQTRRNPVFFYFGPSGPSGPSKITYVKCRLADGQPPTCRTCRAARPAIKFSYGNKVPWTTGTTWTSRRNPRVFAYCHLDRARGPPGPQVSKYPFAPQASSNS